MERGRFAAGGEVIIVVIILVVDAVLLLIVIIIMGSADRPSERVANHRALQTKRSRLWSESEPRGRKENNKTENSSSGKRIECESRSTRPTINQWIKQANTQGRNMKQGRAVR